MVPRYGLREFAGIRIVYVSPTRRCGGGTDGGVLAPTVRVLPGDRVRYGGGIVPSSVESELVEHQRVERCGGGFQSPEPATCVPRRDNEQLSIPTVSGAVCMEG